MLHQLILPAGKGENSEQYNPRYSFACHILGKGWAVVHGVELIMDIIKIQVHQLELQRHRW